jgi:polysaccharide export outer membrane protein
LRLSSRRNGLIGAGAAIALAALAVGCTNLGEHVWVNDYRDPQPRDTRTYVLGAGDVIQVRVYGEEAMSTKAKVRSDGKVTLPLLNDVQAAGYEPAVLAQQLTVRYKDFRNNAVVTVSVEEARQLQILVVGEVTKQGVASVSSGAGVLEALVSAGGLTEFAHRDRIFVLRPDPPARIRFSYPALLRGNGQASSFRLKPGDQVVVE